LSNALRIRFEKYFCGKPTFHSFKRLARSNELRACLR